MIPQAPAIHESMASARPSASSYGQATDHISRVPLSRPGLGWLGLLGLSAALTMLLLTSIAMVVVRGIGIWGVNVPVAWGFAIINFVWWIGIGHAGTLISAILLLFRQQWRTSINRFAEAMTIFAVANAGFFPLLHLGRMWKFYYLLPYPDTLGLWPQWRSPLVWDIFAVLTYFTVSLMFWYVGLLPDLATMRDLARRRFARLIYGVLALGWRGSARHWQHYQTAYLLLAGLATPLVVSVHSIVSFDFSVSMLPGWHSTIFPPYFVAGAIYSGFAMVLMIAIPLRRVYRFHHLITSRHLNNMAKIMLVSGLVVGYGYVMEAFTSLFSDERYEQYMMINRALGPYAVAFWSMLACNVLLPQALWFYWVRTTPLVLFGLSLVINTGMWLERYVIIVTSLHRDFMPSSWGMYFPTIWDWSTYVGTLGFFTLLMLLFVRLLPSISMSEVRESIWKQGGNAAGKELDTRTEDRSAVLACAVLPPAQEIYGVIGEFLHPEELLHAARLAHSAGYRRMDAFTPYPIHELPDTLGFAPSRLPMIALFGGAVGAIGAYLVMWYSSVMNYPWNIGGRPYHSWPSYIPITFEVGVLAAAIAIVLGMLVMGRLPALYHSVFNWAGFERASRDRFFLCVQANDPLFHRQQTLEFLESARSWRAGEVEA